MLYIVMHTLYKYAFAFYFYHDDKYNFLNSLIVQYAYLITILDIFRQLYTLSVNASTLCKYNWNIQMYLLVIHFLTSCSRQSKMMTAFHTCRDGYSKIDFCLRGCTASEQPAWEIYCSVVFSI